MKKFVAIILAVAMVMALTLSVAEEAASTVSTYIMVAAADAEGNAVSIEDAQLPVLVLAIDSASDQCAFGTEEQTVEGTYEIVTGDDDVLLLTATLSDGTTASLFYDVEDDAWCLYEEESGMTMILMNMAEIAAAADAQ